jgi:hypothetical protein
MFGRHRKFPVELAKFPVAIRNFWWLSSNTYLSQLTRNEDKRVSRFVTCGATTVKNKFPASKTSQTSKLKQNKLEDTLNTKDSEDSDLFTEIRFHKWNLLIRWGTQKRSLTIMLLEYKLSETPHPWVLPATSSHLGIQDYKSNKHHESNRRKPEVLKLNLHHGHSLTWFLTHFTICFCKECSRVKLE